MFLIMGLLSFDFKSWHQNAHFQQLEKAANFYQNGISQIRVAKLSGKTKSSAMVALVEFEVRMATRCSKLRNWKKY